MLLVVNCFIDDRLAAGFDRAIMGKIKERVEYESLRIAEITSPPALSRYSHLIISGSEASVLDDNPWDETLRYIIRSFIDKNQAVLGICYGHQFIAGMLVGKDAVRRRKEPELGWANINITGNPIFAGLKSPVCMVSHYDEVSYLTDDFMVIASSNRCVIHAFQYRNHPVWGVQFHPEYDLDEGNEVFEALAESDPLFYQSYVSALQNIKELEQNSRIFENFLGMERVRS